jgi:guanylate kinase
MVGRRRRCALSALLLLTSDLLMTNLPRPDVLILVGPTASGKTTLADALRNRGWVISRPVTSTSRTPRDGEVDGVHYHFSSSDVMRDAMGRGEYIEQEEFRGNLYGLSKAAFRQAQHEGFPVLIVEPKGVNNMRSHARVCALMLEIAREDFEARLGERPAVEVAARVAGFEDELKNAQAVADLTVSNRLGEGHKALATIEALLHGWGVIRVAPAVSAPAVPAAPTAPASTVANIPMSKRLHA